VDDAALRALVGQALTRVLSRDERCGTVEPAGGSPAPAQSPAPAPARAPASTPAPASSPVPPPPPPPAPGSARPGPVALGSDHGGFELKERLREHLRERGYSVRDVGTYSTEACDYPDLALKVAVAVAKGEAWRGIVVDGVGIGSAMAANKVPGIRAATCFDAASTVNAREHNDANVLCIGGKVLAPEVALGMARTFLETDFAGGRHAPRVAKIVAIEQAFVGAGAGAAGARRP